MGEKALVVGPLKKDVFAASLNMHIFLLRLKSIRLICLITCTVYILGKNIFFVSTLYGPWGGGIHPLPPTVLSLLPKKSLDDLYLKLFEFPNIYNIKK